MRGEDVEDMVRAKQEEDGLWQILKETSTREELLSFSKQVDGTTKQHKKIHCFS